MQIVEVAEDGRDLTTVADIVILNAEGRTLMPGLIDAHVHASITTLDLAAMVHRQASWIAVLSGQGEHLDVIVRGGIIFKNALH